MSYLNDVNHFSTLKPPLCPNDLEIQIYTAYCKSTLPNSVLLLGYTKQLLHLSTAAMDLSPPSYMTSIIKQDWFSIDTFYNVIIGDGVLNLVGGKLVEHLSKYCDTLVIRFFTKKIDGMKFATQFQSNTPFLLPDKILETQPNCKILVWNFNKNDNNL